MALTLDTLCDASAYPLLRPSHGQLAQRTKGPLVPGELALDGLAAAEPIDVWGLGLTLYELFSGGAPLFLVRGGGCNFGASRHSYKPL